MIRNINIVLAALVALTGFSVVQAMEHPSRQAICYQFFENTLIGKQECTLSSGTATGHSWTAFSMKNRGAQGKAPDSEFVIISNNMDGSATLKHNGESVPAYSFYRGNDLKKRSAEDTSHKDDLFCFGTTLHPFSVCTQEKTK